MFTRHCTEGIILKIGEKGEADQIFNVFTKDFGRLELRGKSIRKGRSKLKMSMPLFSYVRIDFVEGKAFNTLTDAYLVCGFQNAKKSLSKLSLFYRIAGITLSLVHGQEKEERIFHLLLRVFQRIDKDSFSKEELKTLFCIFSFHLLYFLGYKVYTEKCIFCGEKIIKKCSFIPKDRAVACCSCFQEKKSGVYLEDVGILSSFLGNNLQEAFRHDAKTFLKILNKCLFFIPENREKGFM